MSRSSETKALDAGEDVVGGLGPGAGLEAVITTAAMSEADKSAWCREHGVYPAELAKWRSNATAALADPEASLRASPQATRAEPASASRERGAAIPVAQGPGAGRDGGPAGAVKKSRGDLQQGRGRS